MTPSEMAAISANASRDRSRIRPSTYGPRSLTTHVVVFPFPRFVTWSAVPLGSDLWAQVRMSGYEWYDAPPSWRQHAGDGPIVDVVVGAVAAVDGAAVVVVGFAVVVVVVGFAVVVVGFAVVVDGFAVVVVGFAVVVVGFAVVVVGAAVVVVGGSVIADAKARSSGAAADRLARADAAASARRSSPASARSSEAADAVAAASTRTSAGAESSKAAREARDNPTMPIVTRSAGIQRRP